MCMETLGIGFIEAFYSPRCAGSETCATVLVFWSLRLRLQRRGDGWLEGHGVGAVGGDAEISLKLVNPRVFAGRDLDRWIIPDPTVDRAGGWICMGNPNHIRALLDRIVWVGSDLDLDQDLRRRSCRSMEGEKRSDKIDNDSQLEIRNRDENSFKEKVGEIKQKQAAPQETNLNGDRADLGRSGGVYIPPFKLARMMKETQDKSSVEYQRLTWDALKKSINGLVNKVNATNIQNIVPELFAENLIRGRDLPFRSCMKSQMASPGFTDVFAALVAVVNTKFIEVGDLLLRRIVLRLKRAYKRNDKFCWRTLLMTVLRWLLVLSRNVAHHHGIFERFRGILHEGEIDKRVQFLIEGLFSTRKAKFQGYPAVRPELDLVEQEDQLIHEISLQDEIDPEITLDIFKPDPQFLENEKRYEELKKSILGEESEDEEGSDSGSGSGDEEEEEECDADDEDQMKIKDETDKSCKSSKDNLPDNHVEWSYALCSWNAAVRRELTFDALPWHVLAYIRLTEEDTTSSSRIFIKILFQDSFESIFPRDNPKNTQFSINLFTSIGLGGVTENLREYLKNMPRLIMQQQEPPSESESGDDSGSTNSSDPETARLGSKSHSPSSDESERRRKKRRRRR
ncbi:MIF4G domain-containing protein / MA3 domain-containing protein isoform 3 [Hibiscus syriacus]|uniref:MIF4G domain-containing protein / MA3 domain-containing protein isoform 3 n=1 Tax=Hibiscus syriacus TaxID=106335 RepID=A0A6A2YN38_HIBSY|nr:MIF4G domain-containing protein / MA3 domain-containing protein isoform 3 [Hibiscus syriacus]